MNSNQKLEETASGTKLNTLEGLKCLDKQQLQLKRPKGLKSPNLTMKLNPKKIQNLNLK